MTLRFVKTSILSSEDGIDFGKEVAVESEEATAAKIAAERASAKPLYQQIAEMKERKQQEYDENTKKIFAPPKALDQEDVEFFQDLDDQKSKAMEARARREENDLQLFRQKAAQVSQKLNTVVAPQLHSKADSKQKGSIALPLSITKVKRKVDSSSKSNATATTATSSVKKPKSQDNEVADLQPTEVTAPASSSNLVSMLSSYASDDEKDS